LHELVQRNSKKDSEISPIPECVRKIVKYLETNGKILLLLKFLSLLALESEGIFRQSGSASLIEYYKNQFDQGSLNL
jgi:hypothetical protein